MNLTLNGNWNRQTPAGESRDRAARTRRRPHELERGAQARHTSYVKNVVLSETTLNLNGNRSYGTPYLTLPNGSVLVNSMLRRRHERRAHARLRRQRILGTEQQHARPPRINQLSWFSRNNKHRLKLSSELRRESYDQDQTTNALGTFSFNSLADLAAGPPRVVHAPRCAARAERQPDRRRPLARRLVPPQSDLQSSTACVSTAIASRPRRCSTRESSRRSARATTSRRTASTEPARRLLLDATAPRRRSPASTAPCVARAPSCAAASASSRARRTRRSSARDRQHRARRAPCSSSPASAPPSPIPDWSAYAHDPRAIPTQCADGTHGARVRQHGAERHAVRQGLQAPRSVRSNLNWNGPMLNNRFNATRRRHVLAQHEPGQHARPELPAHAAVRAGRRGRASGLCAAGEHRARRPAPSPSRDARVIAAVQPREPAAERSPEREQAASRRLFPDDVHAAASPGRSLHARRRARAVPRLHEHGRQPARRRVVARRGRSRHQFTYTLGYNFFDAVRVNWFGRFRESATPFTPQLSGDINGDG